MATLLQDLRFAARQLLKHRVWSSVIVAFLGGVMGACIAVFTLLDAAFLRAPPVPAPDRLVWLESRTAGESRDLSYPEYREFRDRMDRFAGLAAMAGTRVALGGDAPRPARAELVSGNYFDVVGVRLQAGRGFTPEEDQVPGSAAAVVLSDPLWRQEFGASPDAIGQALVINGRRFTVIGVAARGFQGMDLGSAPELWMPMAMTAEAVPTERDRLSRNETWLRVVGRLEPGIGIAEARAAADRVARSLVTPVAAEGDNHPETLSGAAVRSAARGGLSPAHRRGTETRFAVLMLVPLLALLAISINLTSLLRARSATRRAELAVRAALGATRRRLVRQLLTESLMLALLAALVGLVVSVWLTGPITRIGGLPLAGADGLSPDARVLGFTVGLALLSGLVSGVVPSLGATRSSPGPALARTPDSVTPAGRRRGLPDLIVVGQIAVSLALVVTVAVVVRNLVRAFEGELGFEPSHALTVTLRGVGPAEQSRLVDSLLVRLDAVPGVIAASAGGAPLAWEPRTAPIRPEPEVPGTPEITAGYTGVRPGYFRSLGIPLLEGRDFSGADAQPVVIVSHRLAVRLWPGQRAVGRRLRLGGPDQPLRRVVGVAADARLVNLTEVPGAFAYVPEGQLPAGQATGLSLVLRVAGEPRAMVPSLERALRSSPVPPSAWRIRPMTQVLAEGTPEWRRLSAFLLGLAALSLGLAGLGIYGVVSHGVSTRTREIGVRLALGEPPGRVRAVVLSQGLQLALVGVTLGLAVLLVVARILAGYRYGLPPFDAPTLMAGAATLGLVALGASYLPARRAARIEPAAALRYE